MKLTGYLALFFLVFLIPSQVNATAGYSFFLPSSNNTLFANCYDGGQLLGTSANISVYYPNSTILLENASMTNFKTGQFNYTIETPATLGVYSVLVTCANENQNGGSFQVKNLESEVGLMGLASLIGFAAIIALVGFLGFKLMMVPLKVDAYTTTLQKFFNIKSVGLFLLVGVSWLLIPFAAFIGYLSNFIFLDTLTLIMWILIPTLNSLFISLYILSIIYTEWGVNYDRYNLK